MHLALVVLSIYTMAALIAAIDGQAVKQRLDGIVSERLSGGVLTGMGVLFLLRVVAVVIQAISEGVSLPDAELGLHVADCLLSPALIIGGLSLWRRNAFGYLSALGLLFQASMLFIGLIVFLLIQPLITEAPFALIDVLVILVMGLICFIPTGLFVQGVLNGRSTPSG
jgi:hypothetical protein